jgi:hypothetical protein
MPLPKIKHPIFETTLPVSKTKVKFRPFTVKEEKILLIAQEANDEDQMIIALKQVLNNCIMNDVDIEKECIMDFEYLFIQLRSKSVNNIAEVVILDPDTEEQVELTFDLEKVLSRQHEDHTTVIKCSDNMVINMRYPTVDQYVMMVKDMMDNIAKFELIRACLESVVEGDEIHYLKDYSREEIAEFVDDFDKDTIAELAKFFDTMPTLYYETKYKDKEGVEKTFVIEGLQSFFQSG